MLLNISAKTFGEFRVRTDEWFRGVRRGYSAETGSRRRRGSIRLRRSNARGRKRHWGRLSTPPRRTTRIFRGDGVAATPRLHSSAAVERARAEASLHRPRRGLSLYSRRPAAGRGCYTRRSDRLGRRGPTSPRPRIRLTTNRASAARRRRRAASLSSTSTRAPPSCRMPFGAVRRATPSGRRERTSRRWRFSARSARGARTRRGA